MDLRLVPLSARHARDLQALASDAAIGEWPTVTGPAPGGALALIDRAQRLRARGAHETFAVCEPGGRLLGVAALMRDGNAPARAELGYLIGRPYRGHGHATAAARRLLAHGFERMALDVVFARCFNANRASTRVIEKLGFRFVGLAPWRTPTGPRDDIVRCYELTREQWRRAAGGTSLAPSARDGDRPLAPRGRP